MYNVKADQVQKMSQL